MLDCLVTGLGRVGLAAGNHLKRFQHRLLVLEDDRIKAVQTQDGRLYRIRVAYGHAARSCVAIQNFLRQ